MNTLELVTKVNELIDKIREEDRDGFIIDKLKAVLLMVELLDEYKDN